MKPTRAVVQFWLSVYISDIIGVGCIETWVGANYQPTSSLPIPLTDYLFRCQTPAFMACNSSYFSILISPAHDLHFAVCPLCFLRLSMSFSCWSGSVSPGWLFSQVYFEFIEMKRAHWGQSSVHLMLIALEFQQRVYDNAGGRGCSGVLLCPREPGRVHNARLRVQPHMLQLFAVLRIRSEITLN